MPVETTRPPLKLVTARTAADICEHFELAREARALLEPNATPREFLDALQSARQHKAALAFLAHALPARVAVWWGCLCLMHASAADPASPQAAAQEAAALWVLDPTEEAREVAEAAAKAAGNSTPAGSLAFGAAWTGGSLTPPIAKVPPVVPGPYQPAKGVYVAVLLAAVTSGASNLAERMGHFVDLGVGVAEGRFAWPDVKPRRRGKTWGF